MIFLARELTIAQLGLEVQIPGSRISGRLTSITARLVGSAREITLRVEADSHASECTLSPTREVEVVIP